MIFSKFFNTSKSKDKSIEHNLLFAPNYLIKSEKLKDSIKYTFGGHSIICVEQKENNNSGLFFTYTRATKSNKLNLTDDETLHLGFQTVLDINYLILGTRKVLAQSKAGDLLTIYFKDGNSLNFTLESCSKVEQKRKEYACNLRARISEKDLKLFTTKLIESYTFELKKSNQIIKEPFSKDGKRKFREAAQSYLFVLNNHY